MTKLLRVAIMFVALFNIAIGMLFLLRPNEAIAHFALSPIGIQGVATIRADFSAFFLTVGLFALVGSWRISADRLLVPLCLLAIALFGRVMSLVLDGYVPTATLPMIAELMMILVLGAGCRRFRMIMPSH